MSEKKRWKALRSLAYSIPLLLVFYVLSIGPVAAILCDSNGDVINEEHAYRANIIYYPLEYVMTKNSQLELLIGVYVAFWVEHF